MTQGVQCNDNLRKFSKYPLNKRTCTKNLDFWSISPHSTVLIHGESNHAKSFIFMPLLEIYDTFLCPSDNRFNFVGANLKQVVFLNDLNYSEETVMKWGPFLNLLEGAPVHISVPKNHYYFIIIIIIINLFILGF